MLLESGRIPLKVSDIVDHLVEFGLFRSLALWTAILNETIVALEGGEGRAGEGANLVDEVLGVLVREEVRNEADCGRGAEV